MFHLQFVPHNSIASSCRLRSSLQRRLSRLGPTATLIALGSTGEAQTVISEKHHCSTCTVQVSPAISLGAIQHKAFEMKRSARSVVRSLTGAFFVSFHDSGELVARFDSTGRFITRIGRTGTGPSEFRSPFVLSVRGDSLYIADSENARIATFSPSHSQTASRSTKVPEFAFGPADAVRFPDGRVVANIILRRSRDVGLPLHLFSQAGEKLNSFGLPTPYYRSDRPFLLYRRLALDPAGGFWAAHQQAHTIERFDDAGDLQQTIRIESSWFPDGKGERLVPRPDQAPLPPAIRAIHVDDARLMWFLIWVPDETWREGFDSPRSINPAQPDKVFYPISDQNAVFDTVIEVFDLNTQRILSSLRVDQAIFSFMDGGFGASMRVQKNRSMTIDIWRIRLFRH